MHRFIVAALTASILFAVTALGAIDPLHSRPGAPYTVVLDFDGNAAMKWSGFNVPATPAYTGDWRGAYDREADFFSPFNVDITTVDPGSYPVGKVEKAIIGGDGNWYGLASGVAFIDGFFNGQSPFLFVFPLPIGNGADSTARALAHETGHTFGLLHQSAPGVEYNPGGVIAPFMGSPFGGVYARWWNGTNSAGQPQDDLAVLTRFGALSYAGDEAGNTPAAALTLPASFTSFSGVLTPGDVDVFNVLPGSTVTVSTTAGGMLSPVLSRSGDRVTVGSDNTFGNIGSYVLHIAPAVTPPTPEPDARVLLPLVAMLLAMGRARRG